MMFRAAIALIALAAPAFAQHGGARGGSFGSRGASGHVGFSSQPGGLARSAPSIQYRASPTAGFRGTAPRNFSGLRFSPYGNRLIAGRPAGSSTGRPAASNSALNRNWDRYPFNARRREFNHWYLYNYPAWLGYGYPYAFDPGFYDWDDSGESADNQGGPVPEDLAPYPEVPYPGDGAPPFPAQQSAVESTTPSAPIPEQPLTVIFKSGRAPVTMQNYMMTTKVLTDLDSLHYQQIPLDQIDLAATQRLNSAAGIDFQIPGASRD
jgi:hypothetical protein